MLEIVSGISIFNLYRLTSETSRVYRMRINQTFVGSVARFLCKISFQDPSRYGKENVLLVIFYSRCWTFSNIINIHFLWRFTYSWLKNWLVGCHRDAFRYISHSTRIHQLLMFLNLRNPSFSRRVRSYSQWMRYRTKRKKRKISLTQFSKHRMNNNLICNRILRLLSIIPEKLRKKLFLNIFFNNIVIILLAKIRI